MELSCVKYVLQDIDLETNRIHFRHICDNGQLTSASISVDSTLGLPVNRQKAISNRLLLGAIFVGLNLLCFLGIMHGHHVVHHTRVNYSHIPAHATRRVGSRSGRDSLASSVDAVFDHSIVDHTPKAALSMGRPAGNATVVPVVPVVAASTSVFVLHQSEDRTEPLANENVVALGSAPRAPGLGRAPPIAA